ncbi:DNA cytosine methyltransferase [Streptomyces niveus]|uniref:DNA cytosine methyltransferase n=1 Tax=Streptomyces niveus TaxID=193462 RepID=UPI0036988D09
MHVYVINDGGDPYLVRPYDTVAVHPNSGELDASASNRPASAPDVVSDPGAVDAWESDGGACVGVESPRGPAGPAAGQGAPSPDAPGGDSGVWRCVDCDEFNGADACTICGGTRRRVAEKSAPSQELGRAISDGSGAPNTPRVVPGAEQIARPKAEAATGPRVVRRADKIREAEAAADDAEAAAGVLTELAEEAYRVADCAPQGDVRAAAAAEAADSRWYLMNRRAKDARRRADQLTAEDEEARADVERARGVAARWLSGEVPAGRGAWLSADGGAAVMFPLAWESDENPAAEKDGAYVAMLADAVAARDEGRTLRATDVPSKVKTGREGHGAAFRAAVATSGRSLVEPWKAPRIPAEGKPLSVETLCTWDMTDVISETEAAPGVWLPMAAVQLAETACGNGWTVAMQREDGGRTVTVRAAGTAERRGESVAYELTAVWLDGAWIERQSGVWVDGERYRGGAPLWSPKVRGRQAPSILSTLAHAAEAGTLAPPAAVSAPAPAGVSDPGAVDAWEGDGGACVGVGAPRPAALPTEHVAVTSERAPAPGGVGGISPELDAYASSKPVTPPTRTRYHVGMNEIGLDPMYRVECLGDLDAARVWLTADIENTAEDVENDAAFDAYLGKLACTPDAAIIGEHPIDAFVFWVRAVGCECPCDCAETGRADECDGEHNREATAEPAEGRSAPVGAAPDVVSDPGAVDGWESDGGACPGVQTPRGPESGPVGAEGTPAPHTPGGGTAAVPAPVREARRRAEEAEGKAEAAQRRAERLQEASSEHYGRFAGGQPVLMGHHSARGAMRDRARGDAATRRAIEAAAEADRLKCAARKARQAADLAEVVHGRSRPWERADFQPGDVVDVRKVYTDKYVVVRANAKTLTLRNVYTVTDTKARYDQVLSRRRDGRTVTDPGQLDAPPASSGGGAVATEEEAPAPGGVGGISPELDACTPKGDAPAFAPNPTGDPSAADTSAGTPWVPAPNGERWDFAWVRHALTRRGLTAGDFGGPDGWNIGPDMWDVMITRVQAGSPFRPRGQARETWDGALRTYAEAVESAGATVVRRNHHCVVVRVPVPAELRTVARARRVGALDDFTTAVTFDGYDGIGGTVSLRSAGAGAATYEVRDHAGRAVDASQTDRRAATASLAHWYGLPTPAEYVEAGRAVEGPALYGDLDACAPSRSVPSSAPDVISDPSAVDTWESDGGACSGVEPPRGPETGPVGAEGAPAPHAPGDGTAAADPTEEAEGLIAAACHPALVECRAAAELLTAHADAHPDDETAEGWAFEAVERVDLCAWAVEECDEEAAAEYARAAKGERAAVTLGQLDEAGPMTPERLATLDADTLALLQWYAGPWPMRWLWPPEEGTPRVINLFHGPGGWSVGIRDVLGADVDMVGVDLDPGAVATATAAGFEVIHASVTDLDPECPALRWVTGIILSPPCQAFSPAGLRMGRYASAIELIVSVVRGVGAAGGFFALVDDEGQDAGSAPRSGESWDDVRAPLAELDDPRAGLMAEVVLWPLAMIARGGSVEWVAVEQSSALPAEIEAALTAELIQAGWGTVEAETLDAVRYGSPSHRRRRFLSAFRTTAPFVSIHPAEDFPVTTFAECAGWARGRTVNTRGQRGIDPKTGRPKGGNAFPADRPSGCITATAYGWKDDESGEKLGQATIGRLVGFPGDYPWTHVGRGAGIRNKAQQAADAVCPMVGAAIIGRALGIEEWEPRARAYADALYRPVARTAAPLAVILPRPRPAEPVTVGATSAVGPTPADPSGVLSGAAAVPAGAPVPRPLSRRMWTRGSGVSAQVTARDRAPRDNPRDRATRQPAGVRAGSRGPPRRGLPAGGSGGRSLPKT